MKKAAVLYKARDAERNRFLAERYISAFAEAGVDAFLYIIDDKTNFDIANELRAMDAEIIVNRTRSGLLAWFLERECFFVSNPSVVCKVASNKGLTYDSLKAYVPMMPTRRIARGDEPPFPYPFVIKPEFGHGGAGVAMMHDEEEYKKYMKVMGFFRLITQPVATELGRDMRVYVIGGKPVAAMLRVSKDDFRSNFCLGGEARIVPLETLKEDELEIIQTVCEKLPIHYAGVDIMRNDGQAVLNELEDPVGARMLYTYTDIDPAALHVEYLLKEYSTFTPW